MSSNHPFDVNQSNPPKQKQVGENMNKKKHQHAKTPHDLQTYTYSTQIFFIEKRLKKIPSVPSHFFQPRDPPDWRPTDPRLFRLRLPIAHRGSGPYHQRGSTNERRPRVQRGGFPRVPQRLRRRLVLVIIGLQGLWGFDKGKKKHGAFSNKLYLLLTFFVGEKIRYRYWKKILRVDRVHVISGSCHSHFNSYLE